MPVKDVIIIGGGISGLSALHFVRTLAPEVTVSLHEAEKRLGGTIGTDRVNGYSFDWGPNGFLDREPLTLRLCAEMGLNDMLERANESVQNRFILRKGKLRGVPMKPPAFLMSDILSWKGKLRLMGEPLVKKIDGSIDESIYSFGKRRIGQEAADYMIQPMVSGIYGGMSDRLSLKACFPVMTEMEQEYGSLFRAMIAKARKAKAEGRKGGGPAGPAGWLTSFQGGLYALVERFRGIYGENITTGSRALLITKEDNGYRVVFDDGTTEISRSVVVASTAYEAADMTRSLDVALAQRFESIPYAPIAVVCMGYDKKAVARNLDGFGFLVPQKEQRRILGSIWTSSIFKDRAPEGKVQFRTMLGGDGDHKAIDLTDRELTDVAERELGQILGISGAPEQVRIYRWHRGIPQFKIGHSQIMADIESLLKKLPGFYFTGNAYYGIGLNDCVKQSFKVASAITQSR